MKKKLKVDRNELVLLELLYAMDYFHFSDDISKKISDLRNYIENKIYKDFFNGVGDIEFEECFLEYAFKN